MKVIFACVHNAERSQMAVAFFNELSAGKVSQGLSAVIMESDESPVGQAKQEQSI
jgi:protein-tyrosine-phosphatase